MPQILATVNINIGLGPKNPTLVIKANDNLAQVINKLISDYQLPRTVHSIIMDRVQQQLAKNGESKVKPKQKVKGKIPVGDKKRSVSPLRVHDKSPIKGRTRSPIPSQKQNNPNTANSFNQTTKIPSRKSVSPIKNAVNPQPKKVELQGHKQANWASENHLKTKEMSANQKIKKLFAHLTHKNPKNVKIMSPEYINFKGLDKDLLNYLQQFFETIDQEEFDRMDESYFTQKVDALGFKGKFTRKEYENSLLH